MNSYNRLLHDANKLADAQDRTIATQAAHIADLKAENAEILARIEKLQLEHDFARGQVKLLRGLDRELHPEVYR